MGENDFVPSLPGTLPEEGQVSWKAPSNIALVKYWGKKENQIPANPSLSFTLDTCNTITSLRFKKRAQPDANFSFDFLFHGEAREDFKLKIETFFMRVFPYLPFLKEYHFSIASENSFPHSSGIASSASSMAALALSLLTLESQIDPGMPEDFFLKKASFLARLGSGSASRSIQGPIIHWGTHKAIDGSSDLYGILYPEEVHRHFEEYQDTILIVDKGKKQVSSSLGHELMKGHPYASSRFKSAVANVSALRSIFKTGDLEEFIEVVESEALSLHAMMMTSIPYFVLMKPNTLSIIEAIWQFREETKVPVCFTLDAGANVHVLYPNSYKDQVSRYITDHLVAFCENGQYICDSVGNGAQKLKMEN